MKRNGMICTAAGALVFVASVALLPYQDLNGSYKLWDGSTRFPAILTILALGALGLALTSIFVDSFVMRLLATCVAFYLLGQWFPDYGGYSTYKVGFWVGTAATLAMSVGGVLAVIGFRSQELHASAVKEARPAALRPDATSPADGTPVSPAMAPAGWYGDPSGQAHERYWSGSAWTNQVRT